MLWLSNSSKAKPNSIRVKFSRYKQKHILINVSFDTLIIIGKSSELPYDTKTLREDAHANANKMSLESDAFAAQNFAERNSFL